MLEIVFLVLCVMSSMRTYKFLKNNYIEKGHSKTISIISAISSGIFVFIVGIVAFSISNIFFKIVLIIIFALLLFKEKLFGASFGKNKEGSIKNKPEHTQNTESSIGLTITAYGGQNNREDDSFEGWFYDEVEYYLPIRKRFKIKYKDANENITTRKIDMYKFGLASFGGFILSYCNLREENRTFRVDRILECVDLDTGEFIQNIVPYFQDLYYNSDEYKEHEAWLEAQEKKEISRQYYDDFIAKYDILLRILIYIVRCDGTYNAKEKAIIKELFENLEQNNELLTDKLLDKATKSFMMPTIRSFKLLINKFIENESFKNIDLVEITTNIISTQSSIHPAEQEVLDYLSKKL